MIVGAIKAFTFCAILANVSASPVDKKYASGLRKSRVLPFA
jgi:hypothetical protein